MRLRPEITSSLQRWLFPASVGLAALGIGIVIGVRFASRPGPPDRNATPMEAAVEPVVAPPPGDPPPGAARPDGHAGPPSVAELEAMFREAGRGPEPDAAEAWDARLAGVGALALPRLGQALVAAGVEAAKSPAARALARRWVAVDPPGALVWSAGWAGGPGREALLEQVSRQVAQEHAAEALAGLARQPPGPEREEAARLLARALAAVSPEDGVQLLANIRSSSLREATLEELYDAWSARDGATAFSHAIIRLSGDDRIAYATVAAARWARRDPRAAAAALLDESLVRLREELLARTVEVLHAVRSRPESEGGSGRRGDLELAGEVLRALGGMPGADNRARGAMAVLGAVAAHDPEAAVRLLDALPVGIDRVGVARGLVVQLAGAHPLAAGALALDLPEGPLRVAAVRRVAATLATRDPHSAIRWADQVPDGASRDGAIHAAVSTVAAIAPGAAAALLRDLPTDGARRMATAAVAREWTMADAEGATAWIETVSDAAERDAAIEACVSRLAVVNPRAAAAWAMRIGEPSARHLAIEAVASAWMRTEPAPAADWLGKTDLPEARKARLRAAIP